MIMKKRLLLLVMVFVGFISFPKTPQHSSPNKNIAKPKNYGNAQPISFMEGAIEFMVFPNGAVDFIVGQRSNRWLRQSSYDWNRSPYHSSLERVYYNNEGYVALVEGIPLDYDRLGRIKRIGNTEIDYNRGSGWLKRVGNLQVNYNRKGEIAHTRGFVNEYNRRIGYQFSKRANHMGMIGDNRILRSRR